MSQESSLIDALAECQEARVKDLIRGRIDARVPASEIIAECNRGMAALGERFSKEECFLPELMFGGMIMKTVMAELAPMLEGQVSTRSVGKVVMGTVQHDVHDVGKDIVVMMLRGVGFEVIDLGVDVAPEKFADAIREHRPSVVGMSVLLTTCFKSVIATAETIQQAGLRDDVKLMVGGAAASDLLRENAGCDFYGKTAVDGANFASALVGPK
ncbi:MAG: hypothetical protein A2V70_17850 [Planctomycetes bacterium RBG_13_63_9]|nr:MAG: hypothetical protein A2V70_17850 [Planctomycetes bacterium RBG_13_63_9]